jgi:hypothetical protein
MAPNPHLPRAPLYSLLYIIYIDCIQGNSKVGDYIIQICYVASMYVGSIALVHRRLMAIINLP